MKKLLCEACHRVSNSKSGMLGEVEYLAVRRRYRTILTQGDGERSEIPERKKGQRGRIAKYDARKLHARLEKHEDAVLRFIYDPFVCYTNNAGERGLRKAKAKIKVSGCFRTLVYAEYWCPNFKLPAINGCNPLVAIRIALAGRAADMVK
ncbi:MAG: transposase [Albidovulum sp.]|nr:transposase [Albidovulum sp.]